MRSFLDFWLFKYKILQNSRSLHWDQASVKFIVAGASNLNVAFWVGKDAQSTFHSCSKNGQMGIMPEPENYSEHFVKEVDGKSVEIFII